VEVLLVKWVHLLAVAGVAGLHADLKSFHVYLVVALHTDAYEPFSAMAQLYLYLHRRELVPKVAVALGAAFVDPL
jgi:hypothetical protein